MKTDSKHSFSISHADQCCPFKGYEKEPVFATVRASSTIRFIFKDSRTLTVGRKTRYATFPRSDVHADGLNSAVNEALEELREKHPRTKNLYVTYCSK